MPGLSLVAGPRSRWSAPQRRGRRDEIVLFVTHCAEAKALERSPLGGAVRVGTRVELARRSTMATSRVGHADRTFGGGGAEAAAISSATSSPVTACTTTPVAARTASSGASHGFAGSRPRRTREPQNPRRVDNARCRLEEASSSPSRSRARTSTSTSPISVMTESQAVSDGPGSGGVDRPCTVLIAAAQRRRSRRSQQAAREVRIHRSLRMWWPTEDAYSRVPTHPLGARRRRWEGGVAWAVPWSGRRCSRPIARRSEGVNRERVIRTASDARCPGEQRPCSLRRRLLHRRPGRVGFVRRGAGVRVRD